VGVSGIFVYVSLRRFEPHSGSSLVAAALKKFNLARVFFNNHDFGGYLIANGGVAPFIASGALHTIDPAVDVKAK
jgi:hypothetical protein